MKIHYFHFAYIEMGAQLTCPNFQIRFPSGKIRFPSGKSCLKEMGLGYLSLRHWYAWESISANGNSEVRQTTLPTENFTNKGTIGQTIICIHFYFLNYFILFLTVQYCIGFAIFQHESTTGIHVLPILNPPPSPYHPSGSSQCTSPKHSVSCIKPGLATRFIYDIIHVSVPFSQTIPPSPSPTESKRLFYTTVSFAVSRTGLSLPSF